MTITTVDQNLTNNLQTTDINNRVSFEWRQALNRHDKAMDFLSSIHDEINNSKSDTVREIEKVDTEMDLDFHYRVK